MAPFTRLSDLQIAHGTTYDFRLWFKILSQYIHAAVKSPNQNTAYREKTYQTWHRLSHPALKFLFEEGVIMTCRLNICAFVNSRNNFITYYLVERYTRYM